MAIALTGWEKSLGIVPTPTAFDDPTFLTGDYAYEKAKMVGTNINFDYRPLKVVCFKLKSFNDGADKIADKNGAEADASGTAIQKAWFYDLLDSKTNRPVEFHQSDIQDVAGQNNDRDANDWTDPS